MESCSYHFSSPRFISTPKKLPLQPRTTKSYNLTVLTSSRRCCSVITSMMGPSTAEANSSFSYKKFVQFALEETGKHTQLTLSPLQENFSCLGAIDGKAELQMHSFESPEIRLMRSLSIEGSDGMQQTDEEDDDKSGEKKRINKWSWILPSSPDQSLIFRFFVPTFFTTAVMNIIVLDLNPLHDVINRKDYKEKYYKHLIPLGLKYTELLPWGGKITAESMKFFSPIVIWTKFPTSQQKHHDLYSAFMDYLKSWLVLMDEASAETEVSQVMLNLEAQHRYLTWRAEKDPGYQVLRRLTGETRAKEIIRSFLFNGVDELGSKTFTDYFPEYLCNDGTINLKRSMIGKSFESRPWDTKGEFIGNSLR